MTGSFIGVLLTVSLGFLIAAVVVNLCGLLITWTARREDHLDLKLKELRDRVKSGERLAIVDRELKAMNELRESEGKQ